MRFLSFLVVGCLFFINPNSVWAAGCPFHFGKPVQEKEVVSPLGDKQSVCVANEPSADVAASGLKEGFIVGSQPLPSVKEAGGSTWGYLKGLAGMFWSPLDTFLAVSTRYSEFPMITVAPGVGGPVTMVNDPEVVDVLLKSDQGKIWVREQDSSFDYVFGKSLPFVDGQQWVSERKLLQPLLNARRVQGFVNMMEETTLEHLANLKNPSKVDFSELYAQITLDILLRSFFGEKIQYDLKEMGHHWEVITEFLGGRAVSPFKLPLDPVMKVAGRLPSWMSKAPIVGKYAQFIESNRIVNEIIDRLIARRRTQLKDNPETIIDVLLMARDENGQPLSYERVRSEIKMFLFVGHDTSALALTWLTQVLATHPEIQDQLRNELAATLPDGALQFSDVKKERRPYLDATIKEVLRLYPSGPLIARITDRDITVNGYQVPKGSTLLISPWVMHRRPDLWPNAELFQPSRFLNEEKGGGPLISFGDGARKCIGAFFGTTEIAVVMSTLLRHFKVESVKASKPVGVVTLRPKEPIKGYLRRLTCSRALTPSSNL